MWCSMASETDSSAASMTLAHSGLQRVKPFSPPFAFRKKSYAVTSLSKSWPTSTLRMDISSWPSLAS